MNGIEYREHDALSLAKLVRDGQVKPRELLACAIEQVEATNPALNAIAYRLYERAETRIAAGLPDGPFTGVPLLIKDDLALAETPMSLGSRFLRGMPCPRSHVVAERLEAAGFVIFGRTNMSELGLLPFTEPHAFGPTHNPWSLGHSTGGSSGGSAAAVAARLVPLAQGSDGGGSIRIPASACGLVGLKPSRGRSAGMPDDDPDGFIVRGCLSRTVRDTAAFLDVIAGNRVGDRWRAPAPPAPYLALLEREPAPMRIAFTTKGPGGGRLHEDCRTAVERTARLCETLGHHVEEAEPNLDLLAFNEAFVTLWGMCAGYVFARIRALMADRLPVSARGLVRRRLVFELLARHAQQDRFLERPFEPFTGRLVALDAQKSPADLWMAWTVMREAEEELVRFFQRYDAFLDSVLGEPPWRLGTFHHGWSDDELRRRLFRYIGLTHVANTAGMPAISLPLSVNAEGLPIGIHLLAPWAEEYRLLALAAQLERAAPWGARRPQLV
ncbi:MAG: amidase [Polyangiaceae bacterium]|nr:amidase [Polyangiaceae bacterium]